MHRSPTGAALPPPEPPPTPYDPGPWQAIALIVAASSADQLANLRDRPPLLIAADSGLHAVLDRGWTPDLVIGDLDSATAAAVETARTAGAAIETAEIDKDETDLELALAAAITRGATDIRLSCAATDASTTSSPTSPFSLRPSSPQPRSLERSVNTKCGLFAANGNFSSSPASPLRSYPSAVQRVTSSGVAFPLAGEELSPFSGRGIANTVTDPVVRLRADHGVVLALSTPTEPSGPDDAPR